MSQIYQKQAPSSVTAPLAVRTLSHIPSGFSLGHINGELALGATASETRTIGHEIEVVLRNGVVQLAIRHHRYAVNGRNVRDWVLHIEAARDRHEQNVEAVSQHGRSNSDVCYRTTRAIERGERLFVWYGEEMARHIGVPILTPGNIRGDQEYVCTRCLRCFQHPNTLKSHILWHCRQVSPSAVVVGHRSTQLIAARASRPTVPGRHIAASATRASCPPPRHLVRYGEMVASMERLHVALREQFLRHQHGALLTFGVGPESVRRLVLPSLPEGLLCTAECHYKISSSTGYANDCPSIHCPCQRHPPSTATTRHRVKELHVDMLETTMSGHKPNLSRMFPERYEPVVDNSLHPSGAAHKRHLCVYCGKLYSRKYGLKIHLRTHTGYKPLRCKVCARPFGDPSNLNKHERLHTADDSTSYRCSQCGKSLARRRDWERHMQSRHPTEPRVNIGKVPGTDRCMLKGIDNDWNVAIDIVSAKW